MARRRRVGRDWAALVRTQPGSGLTVRAFCQQAGVSSSQFYRWRRRGLGDGRPAGGFVQLQPLEDRRLPASGVALVSPQGWRLEVAPGFDASTLAQVLACLGRGIPCSP